LQAAEKEILSEKIESSEVREALTYFMRKYWRDTTRPALLSLFCEAVGGKAETTTPIATSAILISGAVDIHDDIIDESRTKEVGPTVFGKFGKDIALLAGDALLFKGLSVLLKAVEDNISAEKLSEILNITKRTFFELGDAEALELHFRRKIDITPTEYLHVLEKKAAIVEGYAQIGAILGDGSKEEFENMSKYGKVLGTLIMLRDDLIDMIDTKELKHRIERESLPLPVIYALQNSEARSSIAPHILKKKLTEKDAEFIKQSIRKANGIKRCQEFMEKLAQEAYSCLERVKIKTVDLQSLTDAITQFERLGI
jgi:geranylgeranyl pyrophosphate synthase